MEKATGCLLMFRLIGLDPDGSEFTHHDYDNLNIAVAEMKKSSWMIIEELNLFGPFNEYRTIYLIDPIEGLINIRCHYSVKLIKLLRLR